MPYVYSTATCSTDFVLAFEDLHDDHPHSVPKHVVTIKGGANVANKDIITKAGMATKVSDEDLELLKKNFHFKKMVERGFITFDDHKANAEKVAKNMNPKDLSAPKTPNDPDLAGKVFGAKKK